MNSELTTTQREVVNATEPRIAVVAGAGSGKTRVLVERAKRLLAEDHGVLIITLTNAASREIRDRIGTSARLRITTFHALAYSIVAEHAVALGYQAPPTVLGEDEAQVTLKACRDDLRSKIALDTIRRAHEARGPIEGVWNIVLEYRSRLKAANQIDFEFLIAQAKKALQWCSMDMRSEWSHVLIDEAQDCDRRLWSFMAALEPQNIFAVGDPRQAIFGFRGGDSAAFERFAHLENARKAIQPGFHHWLIQEDGAENFQNRTTFLNVNFRSTPSLVQLSNGLPAAEGFPAMIANRPELEEPSFSLCGAVLRDESVVSWAESRAENGTVAILARNNKTLDRLELLLRDRNVHFVRQRPRQADAGTSLIRWFCRGLANPWDEQAARFVYSSYLGSEEALHIIERARADRSAPCADFGCEPKWNMGDGELYEWTIAKSFINADDLRGYLVAAAFGELNTTETTVGETAPAITLSTIHGAKSREWDTVIALQEGQRCGIDDARLWYVAVTRARDLLMIVNREERA